MWKALKINKIVAVQNSFLERQAYKFILLLFLCILTLITIRLTIVSPPHPYHFQLNLTVQNKFLDGCRYIYIDLGTNIGVQIRKLYQPQLYFGAPAIALFQKIFASHADEVCSVGFEANPVHDGYLKEFEAFTMKRGWKVKIFTSTAVSIRDGNVTFYTDPTDKANNQWGASLESGSNKDQVIVPSINIIRWMKEEVINRRIPSGQLPSKIMMKTDIEGHDRTVISHLIFSGIFCSIDLIYGEHLSKEFLDAISVLTSHHASCKTQVIYLDDESYYQTRLPFWLPQSNDPSPQRF